jgi:2-oxoisovalerate dehydrogenase E1 component
MYMSRRMDEKFKELFRKGYVKGTVILCNGNEATTVGMGYPFRPGYDFISILHRDLGSHLLQGASPLRLFCQYMANENSPTHGREGNVHHGNAAVRRFPMISHLGSMLALPVGAVWGARQNGEEVFGLNVIGDGGSSTGDFHESLNIASIHKVPVLFVIENNYYAYSTPVEFQYNCAHLSDRAAAYGIEGKTVDGTDVWEVYSAVCDALSGMAEDRMPRILECMTLRLEGHAAYDKAEYVPEALYREWLEREPLKKTRNALAQCGHTETMIAEIETEVQEEVDEATRHALEYGRPSTQVHIGSVYAPPASFSLLPVCTLERAWNLNAVNAALDYILGNFPEAHIVGQDIGLYGSPFKSCKGLYEKFGADRVMDMPIAESATVGFCLGASQSGKKPIMEFQFADFATNAVTQLGLNCGTWYFRTDLPAQILFRLPCGGGITLGAFHSGEFEGLWSRFPGLKLLYPVTPQEMFEALIAGFMDPNPCLVFEHKLLYSGKQGSVSFDGDYRSCMQPRKHREGEDLTVIAIGAMVEMVNKVAEKYNYSIELWNPFILNPLDTAPLIASIRKTGKLLVVQESGETAGSGNRILSLICREALDAMTIPPQLISSPDAPVPFAKELEQNHIPNTIKINNVIEKMIGEKSE